MIPATAARRIGIREAIPSGHILEGSYEVKIDDGPAQTLKPGDVFYEPPNALHAISRNASTTQPLRYLVIQVSDPTSRHGSRSDATLVAFAVKLPARRRLDVAS